MLLINKAVQAGKDLFKYSVRTNLDILGALKLKLFVTKWLELTQEDYMQDFVGKLLCQMWGFLFNHYWESTQEQDSHIALDVIYKAERFKMKGQENLKKGADNIVNALKESIKSIET